MMSPSSRLALLDGSPLCPVPWPKTRTIGEEEKAAALEVLESGLLSGFRAGALKGGPRVQRMESEWAGKFGVRHAVSFNSLTSGLVAAIGALGIGPGDEVIVPPLTMTASATCVLFYGGTPVFADLDPVTCCLDPESVRAAITPRTRAIMAVHLFGHPAEMDEILALAKRHGLSVIEDCAQAPGIRYRGRWLGTLGAIGGFSLNVHKTIQSGEGGVMVTDDDRLALRMRLIRNHGEVAVEELGLSGDPANTFGGNYRMTEIDAAIAGAQLKKLDGLTQALQKLADSLDRRLAGFPGITPLKRLPPESTHGYYFYPMRYEEKAWGIPRETFVEAVRAEGINLEQGYVRPIYLEALFQKPSVRQRYPKGLCPAAERLHERELIHGKFCRWPLEEKHLDQLVAVFQKVYENRADLKEIPSGAGVRA